MVVHYRQHKLKQEQLKAYRQQLYTYNAIQIVKQIQNQLESVKRDKDVDSLLYDSSHEDGE